MSQEKTGIPEEAKKQYESGHEKEIKFCYFITGLSFAIVGLSIQTAPSINCVCINAIEIVSWIGFLISGLSGIFYLKSNYESHYAEAGFIEAYYLNDQEKMAKRDKKFKRVIKRSKMAYVIRNWAFVISIVFLAVSRGYIALMTS